MLFDTGLFIILNLLAFGFMLISFKSYGIFVLISLIVFMALSLILFSGYDIGSFETYTDGTTQWTQTSYLIGDGTGEALGTQWLGFIYFILGLSTVGLFLRDIFPK